MDAAGLPPELVCPICSCLLEDAVMMPCCAGTACDPCARVGVLRSAASACPVCGEVASTEELIPYRLFRDKVDRFCTQTGYARARQPQLPIQPPPPTKPSLPDIVLPTLQGHRSAVCDSPRGTSPPRPQTPTPSPPKSPGTPLSYPERRSRTPVTPYSHQDRTLGRSTPTTSPQYLFKPRQPGPTLLPPVHVLAPSSQWPTSHSPPHLLPAPVPPTFLHPAEDPLAAFEAAMRKLDSKKASRGKHGPESPPRAYRVESTRSRSRERLMHRRERDYFPHRKSPGGFGNCSHRGRKRGSSRESSYLSTSPIAQRPDPVSIYRNRGKSRDDKDDHVESSWSGPRRERYVTDIPPETQEERMDRERFERNLARRDSASYRLKNESGGKTPPNFEFREGYITEDKAHNNDDTRTPSLSPEPDRGEYDYDRGDMGGGCRESRMEIEDNKAVNQEKRRKRREEEICATKSKHDEDYRKSRYEAHKYEEVSQSDRSYGRGGDRELSSHDEHCEEDARVQDEHTDGLNKHRKREDCKEDEDKRSCERSRGSDVVDVMKIGSKGNQKAEPKKGKSSIDILKREVNDEDERKVHEDSSSGDRLEDEKMFDLLEEAVEKQAKVPYVEKASKKKVKKKKSKKNKSKDKEPRKGNKESRKRKTNKKRDDINEELKSEEYVKSLVPYDEAEDTKTEDSSAENQEDRSSVTSTFISSFKETKIESGRAIPDLPTFVFRTAELPPKKVHSKEQEKAILAKLKLYSESLSSSNVKEDVKGRSKANEMRSKTGASEVQACESEEFQSAPSVSSKWEREDILAAEYPELKHPLVADPKSVLELSKPSIQGSASGPQNVLRKALANMEKDNLLREKKRKSLEGTKTKKKKKKSKKKKRKSEHGSSEDESRLKLKKTKKKKSGFEISEKTLKKLLKKNLIRKEALEKMISDEGSRKKRKNKHSDGEKGKEKIRQSSSEEEIEKVVRVSRFECRDGREVDDRRSIRRKEASEERDDVDLRRENKRGSSEEQREVKASRAGKIQVRLPNRESSSMVPAKKSLSSTVQANLLKMASQDSSGRGERGSRNSPQRKSVKDRLGPLRREENSPGRRSLRENDRSCSRLDDHSNRAEGRKKFARDANESKKREDSWGLEPVPAILQAWAGKHSPVKQDRDTRRSKEEDEEYGRNPDEKRSSSEKKVKSLKQRRKRGTC